jgi:hypothetical protein
MVVRKNVVYEISEVDQDVDEDQTRQRSKSKNILRDFSIFICDVSIKGGC